VKNIRNLRFGYTTGACAAAAAKAATLALVGQQRIVQVEVQLLLGDSALFRVERCSFSPLQADSSIVKDAGDDPDVTNGAEIWAKVSWSNKPGVHIEGGAGVGIVTKPGLETAVGLTAINPVPRQMITQEVAAAAGELPAGRGVRVTISVPNGQELAKRTLNSRLGIVGGISILGTTGIVIPYSVNAYTTCISKALDVAVACGCRQAVLTTGRRSEKFAQEKLGLASECFVQAGDFIGFSLKEGLKRPLYKLTIWGMIGKISKLAAGHLYTNISDSRVDLALLLEVAKDSGVPLASLEALSEASSANEFSQGLPAECLGEFSRRVCHLAAQKCSMIIHGALEIECVMSDYEGNILGRAVV
jgi:cobalt-precorrin-5B (C1)-methyltransferase